AEESPFYNETFGSKGIWNGMQSAWNSVSNFVSESYGKLFGGKDVTTADGLNQRKGIIYRQPDGSLADNEGHQYIIDHDGMIKRQLNENSLELVCFVAGTLIHTENGLKEINDIIEGDFVLSWNEVTKEISYKKVTNLYIKNSNLIYEVEINKELILRTTWNHPFWVTNKSSWIEVKDLEINDLVFLSNGSEVKITDIRNSSVEQTKVYNLGVEENHTYFVGDSGVLVHNYDPRSEVSKFLAMMPEELKDKDPSYKYRNDSQKMAEYEQGVALGKMKAKIIHEKLKIMFDGDATYKQIEELQAKEIELESKVSKLSDAGKSGLSTGVWTEVLKLTNLIPSALDLSGDVNPLPFDMTPTKWKILKYFLSK
ncbi:Hint domain-containing protein, partial [Leptospira gomenensis]